MGQSSSGEVYRRFVEEAIGPGDPEAMDRYLSPGIALPTVGPGGVEALKQTHVAFRTGFADLSAQIDELHENGDWVAARLTWTGTHTGRFMDLEATGRSISITELEIVHVENGIITEVRQVADVAGLIRQLTGN